MMRISIAIPTRERAEYLKACLATCVAIKDDNLEIIVSDNASTDNTREVVEGFGDPRIRYLHSAERISQRANFDRVIRAATGDYILTMGDDDAVLPNQWPLLRDLLKTSEPEALTWQPVFYFWPSPHYRGGGGMLRLDKKNLFGLPELKSSKKQIEKVSKCTLDRNDRLPEIYHGIASRRLINKFIEKTGSVFLSAQVDIYYSVGSLKFISEHTYVRHPFSILAMGPQSGGGSMRNQSQSGADSPVIARIVNEMKSDPVVERLSMPFPCLGFHVFAGIIEARKNIYDNKLAIDYSRYVKLIESQIKNKNKEKQIRALEILGPFLESEGEHALLQEFKSNIQESLGAARPFSLPKWLLDAMHDAERWFRSISYISPVRFELNMKSGNRGAVDSVSKMADWLIGAPNTGVESHRRWRAVQGRALKAILWREPPKDIQSGAD